MRAALIVLCGLYLLCTVGADYTLNTYNNTALAGPPKATQTIQALSFNLTSCGPFSAEALGTMILAPGAEYTFSCDFGSADVAFLFVDDHLVCQSGAYSDPGKVTTGDNPLRKLSRAEVPVRLEIFKSWSIPNVCTGSASLGCFDDHNHQCGFSPAGRAAQNDWGVAASACHAAGYAIAGAENKAGTEIW